MEIKNKQRFYGMVGFAMRAGKLVVGTENICRVMPKGSLKLVVICDSASSNTKSKLIKKSVFYGITAIEADIDTERLGKLIGKTYAPAAVAVTDGRFAEEIIKASV